MNEIKKKLEKLPILPEKISILLTLRDEDNFDSKKLINIIENDPILVTRLIQLANSKYFGFYNQVYTPGQALNLFGFNFTISICVVELIFNSLRFDLKAYDISYLEFRNLTDLSLKVLYELIDEKDVSLKEELIMPLYLQHIGRFILSTHIQEENKTRSFLRELTFSNTDYVEKRLFSYSSLQISLLILKEWKFSSDVISVLNEVEFEEILEKKSKIINIINLICDIKKPFLVENVRLAFKEINDLNFDILEFKKSLELLKKDYSSIRN